MANQELTKQLDEFLKKYDSIYKQFDYELRDDFERLKDDFVELANKANIRSSGFKTPQEFINALEKFNAKAEELKKDGDFLIKAFKDQSEYLDVIVKGTVLDLKFLLEKVESMSLEEIAKTYKNLNVSSQNKEKFRTLWDCLEKCIYHNKTIVSPVETVIESKGPNEPNFLSRSSLLNEEDARIFSEKFMNFELSPDEIKEIISKYEGPEYRELGKAFLYGRLSHEQSKYKTRLEKYEREMGISQCYEYFIEYVTALIAVILKAKTINEATIEELNQKTKENWLIS